MKKIKLTKGRFTLVDDEWYEYLSQWNWCWIPSDNRLGYAQRSQWMGVGNRMRQISIHRVVMGCVFGDGKKVDHKDGNTLNNQSYNLRITDNYGNTRNARKKKNNTSGYKGVSKHGNKWVASIRYKGKQKQIGSFKFKIQAARAYDKYAIEYYGEFANLNFPTVKPKQ